MTSLSFNNCARSDPSRVLAGVGVLKNGESRVRAATLLIISGMLSHRKMKLPMAQIDAMIAEMNYKANQVLFTLYTGVVNSVHMPVVFGQSLSTAAKALPSLPTMIVALRLARICVLSTIASRSENTLNGRPSCLPTAPFPTLRKAAGGSRSQFSRIPLVETCKLGSVYGIYLTSMLFHPKSRAVMFFGPAGSGVRRMRETAHARSPLSTAWEQFTAASTYYVATSQSVRFMLLYTTRVNCSGWSLKLKPDRKPVRLDPFPRASDAVPGRLRLSNMSKCIFGQPVGNRMFPSLDLVKLLLLLV
ncbi:hypothetical protein J1614_006021 [Plenodomus biglobosus]|nr:hypothetical protein J1614_006021 [Plenodomus biglobosus]